jgi:hypothetical protein
MAEVVPFPLVRRRPLVTRQAGAFARDGRIPADRSLIHQLEVQRRALLSAGVSPDRAEAEVRALEAAIRQEVARMMLGGVA